MFVTTFCLQVEYSSVPQVQLFAAKEQYMPGPSVMEPMPLNLQQTDDNVQTF